MTTPYQVVPIEISEHADAVKALWLSSLDSLADAGALRKLNHTYTVNPSGPALSFALNEAGGAAVVGVICLLPRTWHHGKRVLSVGSLVDFAVHPEHRTLGPALQLMRRGLDAARLRYEFTYGLPNKKSEAVCKRQGMRLAGAAVRHAKVLRTRQHLQQRLPSWAAALAAPFADAALMLLDAWRALSHADGLQWRATTLDDPGLQEIWRSCQRSGLFVSERSGSHLKWRFTGVGAANWRVAVAYRRNGQAQGYVIWREADGIAHVGDLFCRTPLQGTRALLVGFSRHARAQGLRALSIEFLGHEAITQALAAAGFSARPDSVPVYVTGGLAAEVPGPAQWYFTAFDSDAD